MDTEVEDFLEHFGVKGQKWGVRKSRGPGGEKARAERFSSGPGSRNYNARKLSNSELRKVVDRMKLEQEYTNLNDKGSIVPGRAWVQKTVQSSGTAFVGAIAGAAGALAFRQAIGNRFK